MADVSNRLTGGEAVVRMLEAHKVDTVLGLRGDTSLPLYNAFDRIGGGISHVLSRDKLSAGYMADGFARFAAKAPPSLVDVICRPLDEPAAPVREWVA